jgi:hypothetical protein
MGALARRAAPMTEDEALLFLDEELLLSDEETVIDVITRYPAMAKIAARENLTPQCFRDRANVSEFQRALQRPPAPTDELFPGRVNRFRVVARRLARAAPNRPPMRDEPAPPPRAASRIVPAPDHGASGRQRKAKAKAKGRTPKLSEEFLAGRQNMRRGELKVLLRYLVPATTRAHLESKMPGRDIGDPEEVSGQEIGAALRLTESQLFKIEDAATEYGRRQRWVKSFKKSGKPDKPYRFSFRTVTCIDRTQDELRRDRKRRSNERTNEQRRKFRLEKKAMTTPSAAIAAPRREPLLDLKAAQMQRTRAQRDALRQVIDDEWRTLADLTARLSRHPAYHGVEERRLRQTVVDRLHDIRDEIDNDAIPGPRGSRLRLVRRRPAIDQIRARDDHGTVGPQE